MHEMAMSSYLTLPYLTLPYLTLPYLTLPYLTLPYLTVPYRTVPYRTVPYRTVPYRTVPYRTVPYRTVPYRTLPYLTCRLCSPSGAYDVNIYPLAREVLNEPTLFVPVHPSQLLCFLCCSSPGARWSILFTVQVVSSLGLHDVGCFCPCEEHGQAISMTFVSLYRCHLVDTNLV